VNIRMATPADAAVVSSRLPHLLRLFASNDAADMALYLAGVQHRHKRAS
jgi:hypothetical protein